MPRKTARDEAAATAAEPAPDYSALLVPLGFGEKPEIALDPKAQTLKDYAISAALEVTRVATEDELALAVEAMRRLGEIRKGVEAQRKEIKAPVLELGKKIDKTAADFVGSVHQNELRLEGMINHFQRQQIEARAAQQKELEAQAAAARQETVKVERSIDDLRIAIANEEAAGLGDELETDALRDQLLELELAAESAAAAAPLAVIEAEAPKGLATRVKLDYRVQGRNERETHAALVKFATAYPHLVKIEIRRSAVMDELNKGACFGVSEGEMPIVPGLEVYTSIRSQVR